MTVKMSSRLGSLADALVIESAEVIRKTAADIEATAKDLAPVDTGALRSGIHTTDRGPLEARVEEGVEYAVYQEYGTSTQAGRPHLRPAAHAHEAGFLAGMQKVIERHGG